jgi:beta-lactamase regulating signal transducer with metallopeptidase domain
MIPLDAFLNAYIDANIMLAFAALLWFATRAVLARTSLRTAFTGQLRLVYGLLIVIACMPLAVVGMATIGTPVAINLSDIAVAQYLDGRFAMAPSQFEQLLMTRDLIVNEVVTLSTVTGQVIAAILVTGIGLALLRLATNVVRLRHLIANSFAWRRIGKLHIRLTDATHVPFSTASLRRRYIILPSAMLSQPGDLKIALAHELQHIRQGDLNWELLLEMLRPILVFNPAMYLFKRDVERLRELACDQQVLRRSGFNPLDYGNCLLRVCRNALHKDQSQQIALPTVALLQIKASGTATLFLRQRVTEMFHAHRATNPGWMIPALLLPLAMMLALGTVSIQRSGDWSQDRLMLSTIVNLERLNQRNGLN